MSQATEDPSCQPAQSVAGCGICGQELSTASPRSSQTRSLHYQSDSIAHSGKVECGSSTFGQEKRGTLPCDL